MFPDEPNAPARGSFLRPVPLPSQDPDASPTQTVTLACSWLPYIRGALQQLLLQATWDTDDPVALLLAQNRVFNLIDLFQECSSALPFACPYDFTLGDEGFGVVSNFSFTPANFGFYVAGSGFSAGDEVRNSDLSVWGYGYFSAPLGGTFSVTSLDMLFDFHKGTFTTGVNGGVLGLLAGVTQFSSFFDCSLRPDGNGQSFGWSGGAVNVDEIQVLICTHAYPAMSGSPGSGLVRHVTLQGSGRPPC